MLTGGGASSLGFNVGAGGSTSGPVYGGTNTIDDSWKLLTDVEM